MSLDELLKEAMLLPRAQRAALSLMLIESLDATDDQAAVERSWRIEIERRLAQYKRGEARFVSGKDVFAEARRITRTDAR
jgi:putative addiction module component (TIGR02574 family)